MKKKIISIVLILSVILSLSACFGKQTRFSIRITVPAGSAEEFVYSHEEISPLKKEITVHSGEGMGDAEIVLIPVGVTDENTYEPMYITPGMPVKIKTEKGAWYKIGVKMLNSTDEDITVYVNVEDVEVRIE